MNTLLLINGKLLFNPPYSALMVQYSTDAFLNLGCDSAYQLLLLVLKVVCIAIWSIHLGHSTWHIIPDLLLQICCMGFEFFFVLDLVLETDGFDSNVE